MEEPQEPLDPPHEKNYYKRKQHGYVKLSKVQKDMELQKKYTEKGKEPGPAPVM